jgi:undecaprenyl-diphosphatase
MGEKGWPFFLLALVFMLMADKRDLGVCIFGAVCCGALITNIILKDTIARPRPFQSSIEYELWWNAIGSPAEDGFSFPSGHVTAATAGMAALCFTRGRKWFLPAVLWVLLMAVSRNYLMAHYPSDVLFAVLIGLVAAVIAYLITLLIFRLLEDHEDLPFCALLLGFNLPIGLPHGKQQREENPPAPIRAPAGYRGRHEK